MCSAAALMRRVSAPAPRARSKAAATAPPASRAARVRNIAGTGREGCQRERWSFAGFNLLNKQRAG